MAISIQCCLSAKLDQNITWTLHESDMYLLRSHGMERIRWRWRRDYVGLARSVISIGKLTNFVESGTYYFMGGLLMVIAGVLEFFCGNTVPFVVSCGFGKPTTTVSTSTSAVRLT